MPRLINTLTVTLALAATALPATACLNDREVLVAENEFKSSYLTKKADDPGPRARIPLGGWAALGLGTALLGATMVVSLRRRQ
jgi:hypothetical protein